ncbi:hypothetical protein Acr_26g0002420 [Actinidia rufa]|uniref:Uncharacterized protein n=1 Tax=Actinidia rufa TaxID=165716 RepID=A0A7J0H1Q1_9ERIC|nr:hypothetical protein Acr_26g0002420 [Actinidia rufa]
MKKEKIKAMVSKFLLILISLSSFSRVHTLNSNLFLLESNSGWDGVFGTGEEGEGLGWEVAIAEFGGRRGGRQVVAVNFPLRVT